MIQFYIYKLFGYFLSFLSRILSSVISTKPKRVLIGCSAGNHFNGNSKRLFEMMYDLDMDVYYTTRNQSLFKTLKKKYRDNIAFSYSFKALYVFLTSEIIVYSHGVYDVTPFYPFINSKKTINLWHGFPFKTIGIKVQGITDGQVSKVLSTYGRTDIMISSSETESKILSESYKLDIEHIKVTGYPRYDLLKEPDESLLAKLGFAESKKIILYAPTFRENAQTTFFPFDDYSYDKLLNLLEEIDAVLLMRFHKNDAGSVEEKVKFNRRIINFDQNQLQEINEILPFVDLLITDYSSIFMDFVIVDKPMIFVPYDADFYEANRGLNFDWKSFYPGRIINTFDDFIQTTSLLVTNPSLDKKERQEMISEFHQYKPGVATRNVIDLINKL